MKDFRLMLVGVTLIAATACESAATARATTPPAAHVERGVYVLGDYSPSILGASFVDGVFLSTTWATVNPEPGVYDWSSVDPTIQKAIAAGKNFTLAIAAGINSPSWLYTQAGVASIALSKGTTPVVWDSAYLYYLSQMIAVFGQQYGSNTRLASVKLAPGLNYVTGETHIIGQTCGTDCAAELDAGYTAALLEMAFETVRADYNAAFPGVEEFGGLQPDGGWPLTDTSVNTTMNEVLLAEGGWFGQSDSLTASFIVPGMTCYQEARPLGSGLQAALNLATAQPTAQCVELYAGDVTSRTAAMITAARAILLTH